MNLIFDRFFLTQTLFYWIELDNFPNYSLKLRKDLNFDFENKNLSFQNRKLNFFFE